MQAPLDLKLFAWQHKTTKHMAAIIAITDYGEENVVVFRCEAGNILVISVDQFCADFEAVYPVSS